MTPPIPRSEPLIAVLHEDLLCPWSWLAAHRLEAVVAEFDGVFELRHAPFPLRLEPRVPTPRERRALARSVRRAAKEPDGRALAPELWLSPDPPLSSVPPFVAVAAANLQSAAKAASLREALRDAALVQGVNVARPDALYELAARHGLDMTRFSAALASAATERSIRDARDAAAGSGVEEVPALVIADEWLIAGARTGDEYRDILRRYLASCSAYTAERTVH